MSVAFGPFTPTGMQLTMNFDVPALTGGTLSLRATYYEWFRATSYENLSDNDPSPATTLNPAQLQINALSYTRYRDDDPDQPELFVMSPEPGEHFAFINLRHVRVTNFDELHLLVMTEPLMHSCPSTCADYDFLTLSEQVYHDAFFGEDCQ